MTAARRLLRKEFIRRMRRLMDERDVTQLELACAIGMDDAHLGFCLNYDKSHAFPAELLGACVPLLGTAVFNCIPGVDLVIVERPIGNVEPVTGATIAVLREAGELAAAVLDAGADVTHPEQARIDREAADLHRATQTAAESTRAAIPTRS